jgi:hypothetical protein
MVGVAGQLFSKLHCGRADAALDLETLSRYPVGSMRHR